MITKGEIAEKLALKRGLITQEDYDLIKFCQHPNIPCPGWDLGAFMDKLNLGQEFLDEVIDIQKQNKDI